MSCSVVRTWWTRLVMAILVLCAPCSLADALYFVHAQPGSTKPDRRPFPASIHQYDASGQRLVEVWTTGESEKVSTVWQYASCGDLVIVLGREGTRKLAVISRERVSQPNVVDLSGFGSAMRLKYMAGSDGRESTRIFYFDRTTDLSKVKPETVVLQQAEVLATGERVSPDATAEVRLAGVRPVHAMGEHDLLSVRIGADRSVSAGDSSMVQFASPIPDSIALLESTKGWNLVANEPAYQALLSVPDRSDFPHSQLVLHLRGPDTWNSVLLEGPLTGLRPINEWLVGVTGYIDPRTDYAAHRAYLGVAGEAVVLVNPVAGRTLQVALGEDSEVLWVESDTVYYRIGDTLYRALIGEDDFLDRTKMVSDPIVQRVHWAFRGDE